MSNTGERISDEILARAVELYEEHGSQERAAIAMGVSKSALNRYIKYASERGMLGYKPVLPGFRISKTTAVQDENGNTVREFIQQKPEHGDDFAVPAGHVVKGVSALTDPDGRIVQQWIKTRLDASGYVIEALKKAFEGYTGKSELIAPPQQVDSDLMSVYPIADQHNGLLAWGQETGEAYDLKIGADRLRATTKRLIAQSPASKRALILNLGDWQHTDDAKNMTPRSGNILDVDSRYFKIVTVGIHLMMDVIEIALQKHESVLLRNLPGNHDPHSSVALTVALSAFYANNPRVTIDLDPSEFFFHRFGQTLIGAHHGHRAKAERLAMKMAVDCREDWGATRYHWFLFGHIHHETVKEVGDVRVESFQTLAANDAFSHSSGYGSGKSLSSVTLHVEDGEIGRHRVNIAPQYKGATQS